MSKDKKTSPTKKPSNYQIRTASLKDLDYVYQIEVLSFRDAYPKSLIWQLIQDQKAICLIIEIDRQIVGFAVGFVRSKNIGHVISIAIDPKHRNYNYGSTILIQLLTELQIRGATSIQLEVRVSNKAALKLYKKCNFQIKETKRRYYSDGEDAYLMSCKLHE